jgi:hypothetical protein
MVGDTIKENELQKITQLAEERQDLKNKKREERRLYLIARSKGVGGQYNPTMHKKYNVAALICLLVGVFSAGVGAIFTVAASDHAAFDSANSGAHDLFDYAEGYVGVSLLIFGVCILIGTLYFFYFRGKKN